MNKKPVFFLVYLSFFFSYSIGQNNDSSQYKFSSDIFKYISKDSAYWRGGITASDLSFIGLYKEALIEYEKAQQPFIRTVSVSDSLDFIKNYRPFNARKFIIEKARENQIIIFNEAHYNPRNRVFVRALLKDLKDIGYKYFAAEAFINKSDFFKVSHPSYETGFYNMEPQFGNLVREATKLNFSLYPYENTTGADGKEREIGQAKNLHMLLKKDPKAKIIVYCGFSHIIEDSLPVWGKAMAGRLKEITGINPFTIDQIPLSEGSTDEFTNPYFKMIHSDSYSILIDKNGKAFNNGKVDALLYSPPTEYIYNRPKWIFQKDMKPYFLSKADVSISFPVLVKAYLDSDNFLKAIPIDIIEIKSKDNLSNTAIVLRKKGSFIIKVSNQMGATQIIRAKF